MRLKRIGNSDQDLYQGQNGKVYNRAGELIHDREAFPPETPVVEPEAATEA